MKKKGGVKTHSQYISSFYLLNVVHGNIAQLQKPFVALHKYEASLQKYSPSEEETR